MWEDRRTNWTNISGKEGCKEANIKQNHLVSEQIENIKENYLDGKCGTIIKMIAERKSICFGLLGQTLEGEVHKYVVMDIY